MNTKLYFDNLAATTTECNLKHLVSPHGNLVAVNISTDRISGRARRFALVTMATPE